MAVAKKLILVSAEQITIKDKETGEPIKKWKYLFMQKDGSYMKPQYDEIGLYVKDVANDVQGWDESKAKTYMFNLKEYQGIVTEKLAVGEITDREPQK